MAGANYMGGKRNAARARVKDVTGKAQRNHFGKQKFNVLTMGLTKSLGQRGKADSRGSVGASDISLAHAQRSLLNVSRNCAPPVMQAHVEPPVTSHHEHHSAHSISGGSTRSGTNRTRKSRLLSDLDTSIPIFFKAERNRICSIPDLAGLPQKPLAQDRPRTPKSIFRSKSHIDAHDVGARLISSPAERERKRPRIYPPRAERALSESPREITYSEHGTTQSSDTGKTMDDSSLSSGTRFFQSTSRDVKNMFSLTAMPNPGLGDRACITHLAFQEIAHADPDFEPMPLDSSPPIFDDLGYAEFEAGLNDMQDNAASVDYEPTRYSFYHDYSPGRSSARPDSTQVSVSPPLPAFVLQGVDVNTPILPGVSPMLEPATIKSPSSANWLLSATPSPQTTVPQQSDDISTSSKESQMHGSDTSLYLGSTSSPIPASTASSVFPSLTDDLSFVYQPGLSKPPGEPFEPSLVKQSLMDALQGQLFEHADPWSALDKILDLHPYPGSSSPSPSEGTRCTADLRRISDNLQAAYDRSGVGYIAPPIQSRSAAPPDDVDMDEIRPGEILLDALADAGADAYTKDCTDSEIMPVEADACDDGEELSADTVGANVALDVGTVLVPLVNFWDAVPVVVQQEKPSAEDGGVPQSDGCSQSNFVGEHEGSNSLCSHGQPDMMPEEQGTQHSSLYAEEDGPGEDCCDAVPAAQAGGQDIDGPCLFSDTSEVEDE